MAEVKVGVLIEAVDDASDEMQKVGNSAKAMAGAVEQSSTQIETVNKKTSVSLKEVGSSIAGLATSAMSLIFMFNRLESATYAANKAQNAYEDRVRAVNKAQDDLNKAIEKYGEDSPEAAAAAEMLKARQDDLTLATERLSLAQQNLTQAQMQTALMAIPAVITAITSLQGAIGVFSAFLATNPLGWLIIALAAIAALIAALATNFMGFRDLVIDIFTKIYTAIKPIIDGIIGFINNLIGVIMAVINAIKNFLDWLGKLGGGGGGGGGTVPAPAPAPSPRPIPKEWGPHLQAGGIIEEAGLAFLHRHEVVVPAAKASEDGGIRVKLPIQINIPLTGEKLNYLVEAVIDAKTGEIIQRAESRLT